MGTRPNIELHIEELVLHGFPPSARRTIAESIRAELESRLAADGLQHASETGVEHFVGSAVHDAVRTSK